jgi:beta-phosphoglucomutase-like phosphatase (HAD superfamily)
MSGAVEAHNVVNSIRAVLFDMDGVLVDSEPAHFQVTIETLDARGLPTPNDEEWDRIFLGRPDRDGFTEWFLEMRADENVEAFMADKAARFAERFGDLVRPFEDGQWLARELHGRGVPLALVSGARRSDVDLVLHHFDLSSVFRASLSSDDVTYGKPDPQPWQMGAATLGVPPSACIVIEDAVPGLRAAEAAGATPIVVDRVNDPTRFRTIEPVIRLDESVLHMILERFTPSS